MEHVRRLGIVALAACASVVVSWVGPARPGGAAGATGCSPGAHSLAPRGSRLYPETGNGGYTSLHTLVRLVYDADSNRFLRGTHVALTDRATQCLTSLSLDFERASDHTSGGPHLSVRRVLV